MGNRRPTRALALALWIGLTGAVARTGGADPAPTFPGVSWTFAEPAELGLDPSALAAFRAFVGGRGAVVRYGRMAHTWGDQARRADVASASKPVIVHFLLHAEERKLVRGFDEPVVRREPRLAPLNAALGFKDRLITWRQLATMTSCYGVQEAPGSAFDYDDYAAALFFDTLFLKVYRTPYDAVDATLLRGLLFDELGAEDQPTFFAYGLDRRQGRLAISVRDLARFGLLYLNRGAWRTRRLLQPESIERVTALPPPTASLPRTAGAAAEMIPGQRTHGGGRNQADHQGSYGWAWWVNGVLDDGSRRWPTAPGDAFMANGHWGRRVLFVVPSLHLVAVWNDGAPRDFEGEREAVRLLLEAVR